MKTNPNSSRLMLITSMCIFGTIGILRRYIPLSSSLIALVRGVIGSLFLILTVVITKNRLDGAAVRRKLLLLALSGAAIGFNWILLFEAYNHTSVAVATLCYYLAPVLVILAAPAVLGETMTVRKAVCTAVALMGMVLVSGVIGGSGPDAASWKGIALGLGAAALYASVILMNKKMPDVPSFERTIFQLCAASIALAPYVLLTEDFAAIRLTLPALILLLIAGIVHTGIAYWLYFRSMGDLPSHTVALLSYIDPILAIVLSALLLREPMTPATMVGAVLILGATFLA